MAASVQAPLEAADPLMQAHNPAPLLDVAEADGAAFLLPSQAAPTRVGSPLPQSCAAASAECTAGEVVGPFTHKETCVVLDWDDTLFPSSFVDRRKLIHARGVDELPAELQRGFAELEKATTRLITAAAQYGTVLIITNAQTGWVELCVSKFFPAMMELLSKTVRVVSARSAFERFFPGDPLCWKAAAFAHELHQLQKALGAPLRNVLSFGDSMEERTAVKIAAGQLRSRAKSVKFLDAPSPRQLHQQLDVVANCLEWIWRHNGDLDVVLTLEQHAEEGANGAPACSILESPPQTPVGGANQAPVGLPVPFPAAAVATASSASGSGSSSAAAAGAGAIPTATTTTIVVGEKGAAKAAAGAAPAPADGASSSDVAADEEEEN